MAVTLSTALTNTRSLLDEPSGSLSSFWSDTELTTWLNESCADMQRRAEWKMSQASIPVSPQTQEFAAPDDVIRIHRITFNPTVTGGITNNTYTLEYRGFMEMDQVWGIQQQWPATYPLYYTLWGQPGTGSLKILTYPVPDQAGTLNVYYFPEITSQSNTSSNMDAPQGFEDMMYDYTCYRALRKDADPRWKEFKSDYEAKLINLYDSSREYQDQANFVSTGQQALPQWLTSSEGW
jgi:hypothetical protein